MKAAIVVLQIVALAAVCCGLVEDYRESVAYWQAGE
jgi:hypothetical protein